MKKESLKTILILCISLLFTFCAEGKERAVLTQKMVDKSKGKLVISQDYTLNGAKIVLPHKKTIIFAGGSLDNGELVGNENRIEITQTSPFLGRSLVISGTWDVNEVHDWWFEFDARDDFVSNQIISNALAFSNDSTGCHIFFNEDRVYYFELPYKGKANLGDMFSYHINDKGEKKRHYIEVYNDEYSFLRIFTIPSHTHFTVNSTLQMLPTNLGAYFVFWEYGKEYITIDGHGTIAADNLNHLYNAPYAGKKYYGEWGTIFMCKKCRNFRFEDITLQDSFGDCLYFEGSNLAGESGSRYAENLVLKNVKIKRARRNGIALGVRNATISGCHFEGCGSKEIKGTAPRSAIDFEPDRIKQYPEIGNQNVVMENCTFRDNYFDVASYLNNLSNYGQTATTIRNCRFTAPIKIQSTYWMRFENCYIPFVRNSKDDKSLMRYSRHMEFVNCEFGEYDTSVLGKASKVYNKYTNCKFNTAVKK